MLETAITAYYSCIFYQEANSLLCHDKINTEKTSGFDERSNDMFCTISNHLVCIGWSYFTEVTEFIIDFCHWMNDYTATSIYPQLFD